MTPSPSAVAAPAPDRRRDELSTLAPDDLRTRRRVRNAADIEQLALHLFATRGFGEVTVGEIATRAEISPRTFFRYFASKDDVVLGGIAERIDQVPDALRARPAGEPVAVSVRLALSGLADAPWFANSQVERDRTAVLMAEPGIAERGLNRLQELHEEMTATVAERMGVDPADDLRPGIIVATMVGALRAGWRSAVSSRSLDRLPARSAEALDLLTPVLEPLGRTGPA